MSPARVMHLIWALDIGGAERQVVEIVRRLDRGRFEPIVGCLVRKGVWGEALEREGVRVVDFAKRPGFDPRLPFRLARFLRQNAVSIVHTHAFTAATWGRLGAAMARTPVVVAHEHSAFSLESRVRRAVDRALAPVTDRFVAVSESLARDLVRGERLPASRMIVIPNGIAWAEPPAEAEGRRRGLQVRRALGLARFESVVGTVGRLEGRKGQEVLLEALAILAPLRPGLGGVLVGEGPLRATLEARARALGLEGRVVFAGRRDDVASVLGALDVFALPSHTEGLSIALLEAAAAARPIVATRVGGNGEVVEDGATGILVPAADPMALARALARLLDNPTLAQAMGRRAAERVRARYSADPMVRAIEDLYESLTVAAAAPVWEGLRLPR